MDAKVLGERIRQAREKKGLNQYDFAHLIGKDQRAVSEYERGVRRIAVVDLPKFAEVLEVPVVYFFGEVLSTPDFEHELLKEFHKLPSSQARETAIEYVRLLSKLLNP